MEQPDDIISVLGSFRADTSYPRNLSQTTLHTHEASTLAIHLSNHLRLVQITNYIEVIKYLSIFFEVDHDSPVSLLPEIQIGIFFLGMKKIRVVKLSIQGTWEKFLNTSSQNLSYILEDIIKITRLDPYVYWQKYVIPYLGSQQQAVIDKVVDSLFDRLPFLLDHDHDVNLKDVLGRTSFVPVGTYKMSQQQQMPAGVKLVKPTELFDPENRIVVGLFFEEEQVFPAGIYGIPRNMFSNNVHEDLIHEKALNLFKYIDNNWDELTNNNDRGFLNVVLRKEWIPTFDIFGKKVLSKPQNCYCQKDKDLWDGYPEVQKVLKQLKICYVTTNMPLHENLEKICSAIYYMNEVFQANDSTAEQDFEIIKKKNRGYYVSDIVELPVECTPLFKAMGVRNEIGNMDLILIIKNMRY
ncbi:662_t:CDS:2 [Funneliformis mosseae]|uniref:662_t:CDS:1 n=1 Tax=Funneliformis mosseae TaxID=27381 RepID=A0A9N9C054_FUNMO|nr:662_t:CDS:2 [Funneliformis mosseae]